MSASNDRTPGSNRILDLVHHARTAWRLLLDPRVPAWQKAIPVLALLYLVSPIDLIPDLLVPVLGPLAVADDLAILLLALRAFVYLAPHDVALELEGPPGGEAIDVTYRVDDRS